MKYLCILLLVIAMDSYAQNKDNPVSLQKQIDKIADIKRQADSNRARLDEAIAESRRKMDSVNMETFRKQNERNLDEFMYMQKERNKKEKQRMWLRLGFGIALLAFGVFAMLRRRKK